MGMDLVSIAPAGVASRMVDGVPIAGTVTGLLVATFADPADEAMNALAGVRLGVASLSSRRTDGSRTTRRLEQKRAFFRFESIRFVWLTSASTS